MQIPVEDIIIRKRIRKNLGDLSSLKDSMKTHGLMNPVVITPDKTLIAGHRRLESARQLGWTSITVRVMEKQDETELLEMEIDENNQRRPLATDEVAEAYQRLDKLRNPGRWRRFRLWVVSVWRRVFRRKK
jgi:ParB family chromosome partitioning protein